MGSRLGRPNKNKDRMIRMIQEDFPNYHPIMELVKIAATKVTEGNVTEEKKVGDYFYDVDKRLNANKEVAQYVCPKLKAIEVTGEIEGKLEISWIEESKERDVSE